MQNAWQSSIGLQLNDLNEVTSECISPGMDYLYSTAAINLCTYFAY